MKFDNLSWVEQEQFCLECSLVDMGMKPDDAKQAACELIGWLMRNGKLGIDGKAMK